MVDKRQNAYRRFRIYGKDQTVKGSWWMPWRHQAKKDVTSCDKPRGVANTL